MVFVMIELSSVFTLLAGGEFGGEVMGAVVILCVRFCFLVIRDCGLVVIWGTVLGMGLGGMDHICIVDCEGGSGGGR